MTSKALPSPPTFSSKNVMYISGVYKNKNYALETIVEARFLNDEIEDTPLESTVIPLPAKYTPEGWPSETRIKCWTCHGYCMSAPITVLTTFDTYLGRIECSRTGCFCTWPCAAYHVEYFHGRSEEYKLYLRKLYEIMTHVPRNTEIVPALHPWMMTEYGGTMSRQEYHVANDINDRKARTLSKIVDNKYAPVAVENNQDEIKELFSLC